MIVECDDLKWECTHGDNDEVGPYHEQEITPLVLGLLPEGGVFLDVGAHVGHYALRAARKASLVIAVEPNPATLERLRLNLQLNEINNVRCLETAAWDGVARFSLRKIHEPYVRDGSNYLVPDPQGTVWGARLDDMLSQYPLRPDRLDVVKIDTEGADIHVINGMARLIQKHRPVFFIEDHSEYGYYKQQDLFDVLAEIGYSREEVPWGHSTYWIARPAQPAPAASDPGTRF